MLFTTLLPLYYTIKYKEKSSKFDKCINLVIIISQKGGIHMKELKIQEIPDFMKKGYKRKKSDYFISKLNWFKRRRMHTNYDSNLQEFTIINNTVPKKHYNIEDSFFTSEEEKLSKKQEIKKHRNTDEDKQELQQLKQEIIHFFYLDRPELRNYYNNQSEKNGQERNQSLPQMNDTYFRLVKQIYNFQYLRVYLKRLGIALQVSYPLNGEIGIVTAKKTKS